MRLLNVHTRQLCEFFHGSIPPYAILSHRWTDQELTFKEVSKDRIDEAKSGFEKQLGTSRVAANHGMDYVWIDTCCIDKRSSAELSESINSMYAWYQKAEICLVYLSDVYIGPNFDEQFRHSGWFTRAWTLQELLAPRRVVFYDSQWTCIGDKIQNMKALVDITAIDKDILSGRHRIQSRAVAERMSWAVDRCATKVEDVAYSLMGLFDVNMPLLYGEGRHAFRRLQEEIIRRTSDFTILLHGSDESLSLFAGSPSDFRVARDVAGLHCIRLFRHFAITNIGLELDAELIRWDLGTYGVVVAQAGDRQTYYAVLVQKMPYGPSLFNRLGLVKLKVSRPTMLWSNERRQLIVWGTDDQDLEEHTFAQSDIRHGFRLKTPPGAMLSPTTLTLGIVGFTKNVASGSLSVGEPWDFGHAHLPVVAALEYHSGESVLFSIDLSFDFESRPCCMIYSDVPSNGAKVWQISDTQPEMAPVDEVQLEICSPMVPTRDKVTGATRWFFRSHSSQSNACTRVPDEMVGETGPVWVMFLVPNDDEPRSRWWTFILTRDEPHLIDGDFVDTRLP